MLESSATRRRRAALARQSRPSPRDSALDRALERQRARIVGQGALESAVEAGDDGAVAGSAGGLPRTASQSRLDEALRRSGREPRANRYVKSPGPTAVQRRASAEEAMLNGDSGQLLLPKDRTVRPEELTRAGGGDARVPANGAELAEVVAAWPALSTGTKATIVSLARAGKRRA